MTLAKAIRFLRGRSCSSRPAQSTLWGSVGVFAILMAGQNATAARHPAPAKAAPTKRASAGRYAYVVEAFPGQNLFLYSTGPHLGTVPLQTLRVGYGPRRPLLIGKGRILYLPLLNDILQFRIGPQGRLTPLKAPAPALPGMQAIYTAPGSPYLLVQLIDGLTTCRVLPGGGLRPTPYHVSYENATPRSLAVAAGGRFVYSLVEIHSEPLGYSNYLCQYRITAGGKILPLSPVQVPLKDFAFPYTLAASPDGRFVYLFAQEVLVTFRVGRDGRLTRVRARAPGQATAPGMAGMTDGGGDGNGEDGNPNNIHSVIFSPSGKWAYALCTQAEEGAPSGQCPCVAFATVNLDGTLNVNQTFFVHHGGVLSSARGQQETILTSAALDARGKTLYLVDAMHSSVYSYRLGPDGSILPQTVTSAKLGRFAREIVLLP